MKKNGGPWRAMSGHGRPWRAMEDHGGPWRAMAEHGRPWPAKAARAGHGRPRPAKAGHGRRPADRPASLSNEAPTDRPALKFLSSPGLYKFPGSQEYWRSTEKVQEQPLKRSIGNLYIYIEIGDLCHYFFLFFARFLGKSAKTHLRKAHSVRNQSCAY